MNLEQSILPHLGKTAKILDLLVEEKFADAEIPLSKLQLILLKTISKNNGQPQCNMADITQRDKTTFTRNINTLERKKLVTRKSSSTDKRSKLIYITPLGESLVQKAIPILHGIVDEVEKNINAEDRAIFIDTLDKIKINLLEIRKK